MGDLLGAGRVRRVRGLDCARPCGVRTVHDRAGFGPCTTVWGSDCAPPCGVRAAYNLGGFRPDMTAPGLDPVRPRGSAPCVIARVRPRADRAEPGRVRPCEAPAAYGPGVFRLCSTVWGLPRVRPRAGLRPRTT
ncbi:hypothetical protein GCM10010317_075480 [Streptomyces mirabilis]|nr:hypothetical protein GCM10010317_075480 [Streptomyces mirabilis]